jgi:hypothetical protein
MVCNYCDTNSNSLNDVNNDIEGKTSGGDVCSIKGPFIIKLGPYCCITGGTHI